jgi:hypothetical protein
MRRRVLGSPDFQCVDSSTVARMLDGHEVHGSSERWTARVYGVYRQGPVCWIQVGRQGDGRASALVRCGPRVSVAQVGAALARWSPGPYPSLTVLAADGVSATTRFFPPRLAM